MIPAADSGTRYHISEIRCVSYRVYYPYVCQWYMLYCVGGPGSKYSISCGTYNKHYWLIV